MSDITLPQSLYRSLVTRLGGALDDLKSAGDQPPQPPKPQPANAIWVDPNFGDDSNDGRHADAAFRSPARAAEVVEPGMQIVLRPGIYRDNWLIQNLETVYIRSAEPGKAVFSNFLDLPTWREHRNGLFVTSNPASQEPWCGFAKGRFLPRLKTVRDLERAVAGDIKMPGYGFCQEGDDLYVILPGRSSPNDHRVMLTDGTRRHIEIENSPNVILDGLSFEGHGNTQAVSCDEESHSLWAQNCISEHGREMFKLSDDSVVTWCQYGYPGFMAFAEDVARANGGKLAKLYDYTKTYNHHPENAGNALYEGRMAVSLAHRAALRCRFSFNLCAQCFDGFSFGQFSESRSYRDAFWYCYDDAVEFESWRQQHDSRDLEMVEPFVVNVFGSAFSEQDTSNQMRGPHRTIRPVVYNPDPLMTPPFLIKNMSMDSGFDPELSYDGGFFHNVSGPTTWGADKNFLYLDHAEGRGARLSFRNSIIVVDKIDNWDKDWDPDCDYNALVSPVDYPHIRGPHGLWFKSIDELKLRGPNAEQMDFRPLPDSPLVGKGSNGRTIGPYNPDDELGNRPLITTFTDQTPKPWAS